MHFCTPMRVFAHAHYKLGFVLQKGSQVVQFIIAHKSFYIIITYLKDESKNKVALTVELTYIISSFSCLTDGVNGWTTYLALTAIPLLIIFVLNSTFYLLSWWKIRSELKIINTTLGQDRKSHDKKSITAAKNMSLFVAAFFIQWFVAVLFGFWSMIGNTPAVIFHINTTFANLGGVLNLGVYYMVNRRKSRLNQQRTRIFRQTMAVNRDKSSETRLSDSTGTMTSSLSTIAQ